MGDVEDALKWDRAGPPLARDAHVYGAAPFALEARGDFNGDAFCDDAPTTSGAVDDDARAALAKKSTELDRARAEVEEWKKLYGDLKSLVDRQLVDAP